MISNLSETIDFLYQCISKDKKKNLYVLIFLVTIASIMEFLSISAIVPLISTLLNDDGKIFSNYFYYISQDESVLRQLIIFIFIVLISFSTIFRFCFDSFKLEMINRITVIDNYH